MVYYMTAQMEPMEIVRGNTKTLTQKERNNQLSKHFMTFNNYTKSDIDTILDTMVPICKEFCFQEETGENGTKHLQGCFLLKKKMRWTEFGLPKKIHWEKIINWKSAVAYCSKDDTRTGEVYTQGLPKKLKIIKVLRTWQQDVCNIIKEEPDDRTIHWVYDKTGCMGKTVFSKYLYAKTDAVIATGGGNKDIACMLALLQKNGRDLNDKTTFIFNFPRSTEGISYKALESVKDGLMTSTKYETTTLVFNCPHVICFSNELPIMDKLSEDRWSIWTILDDKLVEYEEEINLLDLLD
jgi:hypothetical protein